MIQKLRGGISILQSEKEVAQITNGKNTDGRIAVAPRNTGLPVERRKLAKNIVAQLRQVKHQAKVRRAKVDRTLQNDIVRTPGVRKRKNIVLAKEGRVRMIGFHDDRWVKDAHAAKKSVGLEVAVVIRNAHAGRAPNFAL